MGSPWKEGKFRLEVDKLKIKLTDTDKSWDKRVEKQTGLSPSAETREPK